MALAPARGFPPGDDLVSLFAVLRDDAYVEDEYYGDLRFMAGLGDDEPGVTVDETAVVVRAMTRELRDSRRQALADADELIARIVAAGTWVSGRAPLVTLSTEEESDADTWFATVKVELLVPADPPARPFRGVPGFPEGTLFAG